MQDSANEAVAQLEESYAAYMNALGEVVKLGPDALPGLLAALHHRHANSAASALGYILIERPELAEKVIPRLLDWIEADGPIYPDALQAVLRAGASALELVLARLKERTEALDDQAVGNLLDAAVQLPESTHSAVVRLAILPLLDNSNEHLREAGADAACRIGLPEAAACIPSLRRLLQDGALPVREAALSALRRLGAPSVLKPTASPVAAVS